MDELYDLQSDPYELHNLIDDPDSANELAAMKKDLNQLLESTAAR